MIGLPTVPLPVPAEKVTLPPSFTVRRPAPDAGGVRVGASFSAATAKSRVKVAVPPVVMLTTLSESRSLSPVSEMPL